MKEISMRIWKLLLNNEKLSHFLIECFIAKYSSSPNDKEKYILLCVLPSK